jgi:pyruvate dehydrogenase complex dehydrogenase (E1) component
VTEFFFDFISGFYPNSAVSSRVFMAAPQIPRFVTMLNTALQNYQARYMKYRADRGILDRPEHRARKVWAFAGDGEMDEPESLAGLSLAAREGLDNLIFVVNCNLQRLDGPVRGNSSVIQELEGLFGGAGWNVVKLLWSLTGTRAFARARRYGIRAASARQSTANSRHMPRLTGVSIASTFSTSIPSSRR